MIGGNVNVELQISTNQKNAIGETIKTWQTVQTLKGWIDFLSGEANRNTFNAKIEQSSHVFIGDYVELDSRIKTETARLKCGTEIYAIKLIDNPMKLNYQIEIYLDYTGGVENG